MSDKAKAKIVMKEAGMPVIEGSDGLLKSYQEAEEIADKIGYPVIIKAYRWWGREGNARRRR
ncbi:hypothetical protein ACMAWI_06380 [Helicobacter pylori]